MLFTIQVVSPAHRLKSAKSIIAKLGRSKLNKKKYMKNTKIVTERLMFFHKAINYFLCFCYDFGLLVTVAMNVIYYGTDLSWTGPQFVTKQ